MLYRSLIFLALLSFSIASKAAAIPMDAGQAAAGAIQHADTHQDVIQAQGGNADKDVTHVARAGDGCAKQGACAMLSPVQAQIKSIKKVDDLLALGDESSAVSALIAMLVIVGGLMLYAFHRSPSMK